MATTSRAGGTVRNYLAEAENWKAHGREVDGSLDFEELIALGNSAFDAIDRWDIVWHQKIHGNPSLYVPEVEKQILELYELWLAPSAYLLGEIARHEGLGFPVIGAEAFRVHCEDARGLLTPDDEFFGEELLPLQDAALKSHRDGETSAFEELGD